jgi:hypothetical protein
MDVPALVTTSPIDTDREEAGVLGQPGTTILFGDGGLNDDMRSGGRFALVGWFGPCRGVGFELGYAFLEQQGSGFQDASEGDPILARPYANALTGSQDSALIAYPDVLEGSIAVDAATRFHTAEVLFRKVVSSGCGNRVDVVIGYRFGKLEDDLRVTDELISEVAGAPDATIDSFDRFETSNTFNGPEIGVVAEKCCGPWSLELAAKVALGNTNSTVLIDGSTTTETLGTTETTPGGLLALPSNMGRYERDSFSGLTELDLRLNYRFACRWRASIGYTLLYWYYVARAGEQIDTTLNLSQLPPGPFVGAARPEFELFTQGFWAQGLNFGLEYRF